MKAKVATQLIIHSQSKELLELNASKDKFFSILAHDHRGTLGNFMVLTEMMADESQFLTPNESKDTMQDLKNTSRNIYNLLKNLLEGSRMQRGQTAFKPDKIALDEVVTDCVKLVYDSARKKMVGITVNIPVDTEDFADINMLQCLLRNLISNAIKIYATGWIYNPFGQTC